MSVEWFREDGRRAFRFLIKDYGFREVPQPKRQFVNEYMVCFSNGVTWVGVEGINWGFGVDVRLASHDAVRMRYPTYAFGDLLTLRAPGFVELTHAESATSREVQKALMNQYAGALQVHADDVLRGDFRVFPQLAEAITRRGGLPKAAGVTLDGRPPSIFQRLAHIFLSYRKPKRRPVSNKPESVNRSGRP